MVGGPVKVGRCESYRNHHMNLCRSHHLDGLCSFVVPGLRRSHRGHCIPLTLSRSHLGNWNLSILGMNNLWEEVHSPANLWSYNPDWSSYLLMSNGHLLVMDNHPFWTSWNLCEEGVDHKDPCPLTWGLCSWDQMVLTSSVGDLRYELGVLSSLEGGLWMTSL